MKKFLGILFINLIIAAGSFLFAENAVVTYVKGKVEVQKGDQWVAVKPGDEISKSQIISTGFQSEAKVKLLDSVLYLGPVTRIAVEELAASASTDKVSVYLKTGTVRSQVNHTENKRVNYQVHTAIAVASARGTDYVVCNDETMVIEGIVAVEKYIPVQAAVATEVAEVNESEEVAEEINVEAAPVEPSNEPAPESEPLESKGVLVKANQSVKVEADSSNSNISAPVNKVVQNVAAVVSAGTTAAAKEAVQSSSASSSASAVTAVTSAVAVESVAADSVTAPVVSSKGFVEISVSVAD